jgi:hypothetical protein
MRRLALILVLPLAACASVEERTDARSGSGFSTVTTAGAGAAQVQDVNITMQGYDDIPFVRVAGTPASLNDAAQIALAAGGAADTWAPVTFGGTTYAMRQVEVGRYNFTVAEPQDAEAVATPELLSTVAVRTGCIVPGQSIVEDGRIAVVMNCS